MPPKIYLHEHPQFKELIRIVGQTKKIDPSLVEKDYWIMQCLYGLQQMNLEFELKGGTSLSKGYNIIERFSEDIDIRIEPPKNMEVKMNRNQDKPAHRESRKSFYDWLATIIKIPGIDKVERDTEFDTASYLSGGIRLLYKPINSPIGDLRDGGVLLELGFDNVNPNRPIDISSWAYDHAASTIGTTDIIDNRAKGIKCYFPGYTLVEKLQTISTKFRNQQNSGTFSKDFMRHYYDVYCLLGISEVQTFIGSAAYLEHKEKRFPKADNQVISKNEAFLLSDPETRKEYDKMFRSTPALYYGHAPVFSEILDRIHKWVDKL